ncbi:MAG: polysaccharide deacetylase family protein [Coriobacteriales bacterium]|nr:polysaccharide deacetylase family protein [Coriobacteriales bacterium]
MRRGIAALLALAFVASEVAVAAPLPTVAATTPEASSSATPGIVPTEADVAEPASALEPPSAEATPVPEKPKPAVKFRKPKIAIRKDRAITLTGTLSFSGGIVASDTVRVRIYRYQKGRWKLRWTRKATKRRINKRTVRWRVAFKPKMRGRFKVQAMASSWDGRFRRGFSSPRRFRSVSARYVALTFDDGAWTTTDRVRRALDRGGAKATFFMVGQHTKSHRAAAKRVAGSGHQIAVHTMTHPMLTGLSNGAIRRQLVNCRKLLKRVTGKNARWYRPPGGATSSRVRRVARSVGLREMMWTVDTRDWTGISAGTIRSRAVRGARPGGVILMHDGGGNRRPTAAAVPGIVRDLRSRGYDFVTLDEWAALR